MPLETASRDMLTQDSRSALSHTRRIRHVLEQSIRGVKRQLLFAEDNHAWAWIKCVFKIPIKLPFSSEQHYFPSFNLHLACAWKWKHPDFWILTPPSLNIHSSFRSWTESSVKTGSGAFISSFCFSHFKSTPHFSTSSSRISTLLETPHSWSYREQTGWTYSLEVEDLKYSFKVRFNFSKKPETANIIP